MMNRKIKSVMILSLFLFMNVAIVNAYIRYGPDGEWPINLVSSLYYYNYSSYSASTSASDWNSEVEVARLYEHVNPGSCYVFLFDTSGESWMAMTDHYPGPRVEYEEVGIYYNTDEMDNLSSTGKIRVITHEFGHCLGLNHEILPTMAIMLESYSDLETYNINEPQADDIAGIDAIY